MHVRSGPGAKLPGSVPRGPSGRRTGRVDTVTGETRKTLTGHTDAVQSVAFSPNDQTLATSSRDRTARLWDVGGQNR
ncbi:hypothetical protein [Streptomyces sp. NPDC127112]|uniref:hypothetical protein n=1 Tax=Streptomyces sp. NPDC127112 TaxID=3345364 RepID=UPI00363774F3